MFTYRLLSAADSDSLFECFLTAFSDYQAFMQMSREEFDQRLARDGVRLEISAGAFDEGRMIGFYINALGEWNGKRTAYDGGTGVIPAYRRQGVAEELFAFMTPRLVEAGVSQYLLEVLTVNERAVALYRKLGFVEKRRLAVFRRSEPLKVVDDPSIRRVEKLDWELFKSFWDGYPSWQKSSDCVERVANARVVVCAYVDDRCVGYGVAFKPGASLMQLAVDPAHRRKGIGSRILSRLQSEISETESLKVNNIDEELKGTLAFYEANGFQMVLEQFEMLKALTK
ncbi:MAG TPA: GNAT family N-acetyltransferase [Pyrinomonadaceae bacterium]|nr:GNAT family N-acetyltransferase [Pyrinomonadaceae bacterium]